MEEADIVIIGAGVVGLAVAARLAKKEKSVVVLERNSSFGQETSSRNSEVIHGGMYYPSSSLKARLCVEGRRLLYEICRRNRIPYQKTGKLIVAFDESEAGALEKIFLQGKSNRVDDLCMMGKGALADMEPNVQGAAALYSPSTGIIDSHKLMRHFLDSAREKGAVISFNSEVTGIASDSAGYRVLISNNNEEMTFKAEILINCAGLDSDEVARIAGFDIDKFDYRLHYCRGQYFRVSGNKQDKISRLIYPVPKPKSAGLGVHATLDLAGSLRLGPDTEYLTVRNRDYSVDVSRRDSFYRSASRLMPFIKEDELVPDMSGIRPKLQGPDEDFRDFVIADESDKGFPGFINLIGIESPGLTASPAIAEYVEAMLN